MIISYEQLGLLWQNIHEYESSINIYQQGLNIEYNNLSILSNLAYCYLQDNQLSLAKKSLEKIIKLEPNPIQAYGELGYIYILENNLNLGIQLWQKMLKKFPFQEYLNWYNNLQIPSDNITLNTNLIRSLQNHQNQGEIALYIAHLLFNKKNIF
ncbi:tetratricopeptide repeat protein [Geminocystis herdmanii]|uniref:tetratricopeptide repeat protein n=1 Tax=Geminocystis herdmanii TaxID=669359 RepID=UPI00034CA151|nr:tetratricopeptide repeat protein [Geminocystis herdmanii]